MDGWDRFVLKMTLTKIRNFDRTSIFGSYFKDLECCMSSDDTDLTTVTTETTTSATKTTLKTTTEMETSTVIMSSSISTTTGVPLTTALTPTVISRRFYLT